MPVLNVSLLGGVSIQLDNRTIEFDTRKATALLAYLLVTGRSHSRDSLAALLWPDSDQVSARGALRRTLSSMRKALGENFVEANRETVGLHPVDDLWVDIVEFRQVVRNAEMLSLESQNSASLNLKELKKAESLYKGDFLAGFGLRDSVQFDDWQFQESEQYRREFAWILVNLIDLLASRDEYDSASLYARRWLSLDPLNEAAHRKLMVLYALAGRRETALRQYRECVRILDMELGVMPLEETTHLYEDIKLDRLSARINQLSFPNRNLDQKIGGITDEMAQAPTTYRSTFGISQLPFVGRDGEFSALLQQFDYTKAGGRFVALEGEAGIGKTRLAEELNQHAIRHGGKALSIRCYQGEQHLALAPIAAAIRTGMDLADNNWWQSLTPYEIAEAARLVPELANLPVEMPITPPLDLPGARSRFFRGITRVILALAVPTSDSVPTILYFDDVHWADDASIDLLSYLVRRIDSSPVLVLCTWQNTNQSEMVRLHSLLADMERAGRGTLLRLTRLLDLDVDRLIAKLNLSGADLPVEWGAYLKRESEGLPFFLSAYLDMYFSRNLSSESGLQTIPVTVSDMLRARMNQVSEPGRQTLQTAAVIGRSFPFDILLEASGRSEEEVISAVEELTARGLVKEIPLSSPDERDSIQYDFNHEKMRQLVYEGISLARARLLHRRIAESLARRTHGRENSNLSSQIAQHYRLAGDVEKAAIFLHQAGVHARLLYANSDALDHFRNSLALGYVDKAELHLEIGDLLTLKGEYIQALHSFETAAAIVSGSTLATAERKIGQIYDRLGDWAQAEDHYHFGLLAADSDAAELRAQILADWSLTCHRQGALDKALGMAHEALAQAEIAGEPQILAKVHNLLGVLARRQGDLQAASRHLEESLALAEQLGQPAYQIAALNNLALAASVTNDLPRAMELTEKALSLCTALGDRHREAALRSNLADILQAFGKTDEAMQQLKVAVAIFAEIGEETGEWQPEIWKLVEW